MMPLTISLEHAAEIFGTTPTKLRTEVKKKKIAAVEIGGELRVSIFVLADLLGTTPAALLDYLEDDTFGRLLEQADRETGLGIDQVRKKHPELFRAKKAA